MYAQNVAYELVIVLVHLILRLKFHICPFVRSHNELCGLLLNKTSHCDPDELLGLCNLILYRIKGAEEADKVELASNEQIIRLLKRGVPLK